MAAALPALSLLYNMLLATPVPLWGLHCGPGHGVATSPPQDALDEACMQHDACLGACDCAWNAITPCACACHGAFHAALTALDPPPRQSQAIVGLFTTVMHRIVSDACAPHAPPAADILPPSPLD